MPNLFELLNNDILLILFKLLKNDYLNIIKAFPESKNIRRVYNKNIKLIYKGLINPDEWFNTIDKELQDFNNSNHSDINIWFTGIGSQLRNFHNLSANYHTFTEIIFDSKSEKITFKPRKYNPNMLKRINNSHILKMYYYDKKEISNDYSLVYKIKYRTKKLKNSLNLIPDEEYYVLRHYIYDPWINKGITMLFPVKKGWSYFWNHVIDFYIGNKIIVQNNLNSS